MAGIYDDLIVLTIGNTDIIYDRRFDLHHFMEFSSNEKWKCPSKNCPIHWTEPFHCQENKSCIYFLNSAIISTSLLIWNLKKMGRSIYRRERNLSSQALGSFKSNVDDKQNDCPPLYKDSDYESEEIKKTQTSKIE